MSDVAYDPIRAREAGYTYADRLRMAGVNRQAGGQLAAGNYGAGANTLLQAGDLQNGLAVRDAGAAQEAAQRTQQMAERTRNVAVYRQALDAIKTRGGSPQALDEVAPYLRLTGVDDAQLAPLRQALATDPQGAIWTLEAALGREEMEIRDGGGGDVVGVNKRTGESRLLYDAPDRPIATQFGILLPPNANPSAGAPMARSAAPAAVTGSAIQPGGLWSRQVQQESGGRQFNSDGSVLTSPAGAFGVAQLMPGTASDMARQMGVSPEQLRSDPALNERAGQLYQQQQLEKYQSPELALAAYNAGPGRVDEWIQRFGDPRKGEISVQDFVARIPFKETRDYVQNITRGQQGAPVAQGDAPQQDGAQDLGGGWALQQLETPGDRRANQSLELSRQANERAAAAAQREAQRFAERNNPTPAQIEQNQRADRTGTSQLRREFNGRKEVAEFREVDNAFRSMQTAVRDPSPAGDINLIFSYMKVLDPTSTVREGEFATASNAGSAFEALGNQYNRVLQGTRLNARQRQDFLNQAGSLRASREQRFNQIRNEYAQEAQIQGYVPDAVVGGVTSSQSAPRTNAPGLRFNITEPQLQRRQALVQGGARPNAPVGGRLNPRYINPADPSTSYGNVRRGEYFVTPDGQLRGPKP